MNFIKWLFTLRRITMIVVYFLLVTISVIILDKLNFYDNLHWTFQFLISFFLGFLITEFIDWNYKQNDYEIIRDIQN